ncbi:histidine kinase [bacterium SCSIO 12741]|nr:histidine kinase [bacterium SCSIO 12741]
MMVLLAGALMSGGVYLNYRRKRNLSNLKTSLMELEFRSLGTQLNPHFVNNALNSASAQIAKKDLKTGLIYLSNFGKLMRTIFNNSAVSVISLEDELDAIRQYLNLEKIRLKDRIEYSIEIDPAVDTFEHLVPSLFLQPLVENAIWHGILPGHESGKVVIKVHPKDQGIEIQIRDNGVGFLNKSKSLTFQESRETKDKHRHSLEVVQQRLKLMEKVYKTRFHLEIRELEPNSPRPGTLLSIFISEIPANQLT